MVRAVAYHLFNRFWVCDVYCKQLSGIFCASVVFGLIVDCSNAYAITLKTGN